MNAAAVAGARTRHARWWFFGLLAGPCLAGCLDQLVSDKPGYSPSLIAPDGVAPLVTENEALAAQIDAYDGIDGDHIPLRTGFADGETVRFWDFGPAPASVAPVYLFRERVDGEEREIGHMNLIDVVPGDPGYSPYWSMYKVFITERYDGEQITSTQALQDAIELGLVEEPVAVGMAANCPVVLPHVDLEVGGGESDVRAHPGYYRGHRVHYFHFSDFPLEEREDGSYIGRVPVAEVYELVDAQSRSPLSEPLIDEDLNEDGDTVDTNDVFQAPRGDPRYRPLNRRVVVGMADDYEFGEIDDASLLVEDTVEGSAPPQPTPPAALWVEETGELVNRPLQPEPGST